MRKRINERDTAGRCRPVRCCRRDPRRARRSRRRPGWKFRPCEPLDVAADLDDVLPEKLDDERGGPWFVRVQERFELPLAAEAVVVSWSRWLHSRRFQVIQSGDGVLGKLEIVKPVRDHHWLAGHDEARPGTRITCHHRPDRAEAGAGKRLHDGSDDQGQSGTLLVHLAAPALGLDRPLDLEVSPVPIEHRPVLSPHEPHQIAFRPTASQTGREHCYSRAEYLCPGWRPAGYSPRL
jgi:hypothetical protein